MRFKLKRMQKPAHKLVLRRILLLFCAFAMVCPIGVEGVSMRRDIDAPSPTHRARRLNPPPERDIDVYLGKVVRKDGNVIIVNITTNFRSPDRKAIFFGCDTSMTPTSILKPTGIIHRNCAAFEIAEGDAIVGDSVMAKYLAPKKEENKESGRQ